MSGKGLSRRDVLLGTAGVVLGGAIAVAGGLGYREMRRRQITAMLRPYQAEGLTDDGWMLTPEERRALDTRKQSGS